MAVTVYLLFVAVMGFVIIPSVVESLPFNPDDGPVRQQLGNMESEEEADQTDGAEQMGSSNEDNSEEVNYGGTPGSSVGGVPVDPPMQPGPVNPVGPDHGAPAAVPRYPVDVPKYPDIGPAPPNDIPRPGNPGNGPFWPPVPPTTRWPPAIPLTTRMRGDGGFVFVNPKRTGGMKAQPDLKTNAKPPIISNNIAHIAQEESAPQNVRVPFPAILSVVVIGGVVLVMVVGGVAYYVATRVRIT